MALITELAIYLAIAVLVHYLFNFFRSRARILQTFTRASIPGPPPSFITGNFPEYLKEPHEALDKWTKQYGHVFGYFQGTQPVLVLSDLADVQEVLVKLGPALPNRQGAVIKVEPFNSSLILQRGSQWKRSRRILSPSFTAHKLALDTTKNVINDSLGRFMTSIEDSSTQNCYNISFGMKCLSLDVITRLAFNMDPVDIYEAKCPLREMTIDYLENSPTFPIALTAYFPTTEVIFHALMSLFGSGALLSSILAHLEKIIAQYQTPEEGTTKVNILDFMLEQKASGNLNDTELIGNAILILLAGYETSAVSNVFTLYLLAKHPEIQEKLRRELLEIREESGIESPDATFYDDHKCELLDKVWYEALRIFPPVVTFITRELDDSQAEVILTSGIKITRGVTVQVPVRYIHHNASHWPQPYTFNPDRANLPDNLSGSTPGNSPAFLPFGAGPRNCIGRFLALSEARAVISSLLLKYRIELATEDSDPETGLLKVHTHTAVMHPAKDVQVRLLPLDGQ